LADLLSKNKDARSTGLDRDDGYVELVGRPKLCGGAKPVRGELLCVREEIRGQRNGGKGTENKNRDVTAIKKLDQVEKELNARK
jgi:hypothetical protein